MFRRYPRREAPRHSEGLCPAGEWRRRLLERIAKARIDEIVPAIRRAAFGGLIARDNEALSRTGHCDVEQAPMLARLRFARLGPRSRDRIGVLDRFFGPGEERRVARLRAGAA